MHHFHYRDGELCCEDVPLREVAARVGTPCYVYSAATLTRHFQVFDGGFQGAPHLTCFAVKSCSNLAILNLFARMGGGADIVSGGELFRALRAGISAEHIIYSGVGKTERELAEALKAGVLMINIESPQELDRVRQVAASLGVRAPVAFRVNPDVDPKTHAYISTGLAKNKFGVPVDEALAEYHRAAAMPEVEVLGLSCHIGSQLTQVEPFIEALRKLKAFLVRLTAIGVTVRYLDLGGGLGITYDAETPPHPHDYAAAITAELAGLDLTLVLEPGRVLVGNGGVLLTEVQFIKQNLGTGERKNFVVVDAAMNDLARPSLYGAYHEIRRVREPGDEPLVVVDVVGPICESGDFLAKERLMPPLLSGDLLAVMSSGAYGFSMASNYNSRQRAAEVLVSGGTFQVIRARESYEDLVRGEILAEVAAS